MITIEADDSEDTMTVKSLAAMLGWGNVPPRRTLEMELSAMKRRLADLTEENVALRKVAGLPTENGCLRPLMSIKHALGEHVVYRENDCVVCRGIVDRERITAQRDRLRKALANAREDLVNQQAMSDEGPLRDIDTALAETEE